MEISFIYLIKNLILPPGINLLLFLIGYFLLNKHNKSGRVLILISLLTFYLFSTSFISRRLAGLVETTLPLPIEISSNNDRQAIIILGGGSHALMPEYGKRIPYPDVLERLRYGRYIQKQTDKPILLTGGKMFDDGPSEAWIMDQVLRDDYETAASWLEEGSRNTAQNAQNSFAILNPQGVDKIYLVTHASHMTRAAYIFEQAGFDVVPAPTIFLSRGNNLPLWIQLFPSSISLELSHNMLHEFLGLWWYKIRYH